jgi:hypothetical protein
MKKILLSSLFCSSLLAWGTRFAPPIETQDPTYAFPFNADQGWFVEESYLLMKPVLSDLIYGDMVFAKSPSSTETHYKVRVKEPSFEWNSGARVGIGRYLPNHDKWDISFYTTYFYGEANDHSNGDLTKSKALSAAYVPFVMFLSQKTKATWRMNYFVTDLMLGRQFSMTPRTIFHPYIGLRGAFIYTHFNSNNSGSVTVTTGISTVSGPGSVKIRMEEDFWGVGPRVGSYFDYKFTGNWSFLSNLAASFLYGHTHVKDKNKASFVSGGAPYLSKAFDHDDVFRTNIEGAVGLGWEKWFQNNSIRIAPTFLFEGSLWFDMNDFFNTLTVFSQDRGNLGLMGFSFNLQVDF